jgi:hypothetical protein
MKRFVLLLVVCILATPAFACNRDLFDMMDAGLPSRADKTFDVAEAQSTDGGEWKVYFAPAGKTVTHLVRNDLGESGRWDARLIIASPEAYAVTTTHYIYSVPYYVENSLTVREEKDIYVFCNGKLLLAPEGEIAADPEYQKKAVEALKTFDAPEVAEYVRGLKR